MMSESPPVAQLPASSSEDALDVRVRPGARLVVEVRGELDVQSAPWLRDQLLRTIRRYGPRVAVDLGGVTFMDCAGINVLLATRRRARLEGGWMRVVRPSPAARRVILLLGLSAPLTQGA